MSPRFHFPLLIRGAPGTKDLIEEAPLHFFVAGYPHVVGSPGQLDNLVVTTHVHFFRHRLGGHHLQALPFSRHGVPPSSFLITRSVGFSRAFYYAGARIRTLKTSDLIRRGPDVRLGLTRTSEKNPSTYSGEQHPPALADQYALGETG